MPRTIMSMTVMSCRAPVTITMSCGFLGALFGMMFPVTPIDSVLQAPMLVFAVLGSLVAWLGATTLIRPTNHTTVQKLLKSEISPHIHGDIASLTPSHMAFEHLRNMRGTLGTNVIDRQGNFARTLAPLQGPADAKDKNAAHQLGAQQSKDTDFMPWWEEEYRAVEWRPDFFTKWLMCASIITIQAYVSIINEKQGSLLEHCPVRSSVGRSLRERALAWWPAPALIAASLSMRWVLLRIPERTVPRIYNWLVVTWCIMLWLCMLHAQYLKEVAVGQPTVLQGQCALTSHIHVTVNYSSFLPVRTCVDKDPKRTVTAWPFINNVGCGTNLVDSTYPRILEVSFLFVFLRCTWRSALVGVLVQGVLLVVFGVCTGSVSMHLLHGVVLHLSVGLVSSYLCYCGTKETRDQFAKFKGVQLAAKQSRTLLYTLIPPNVLARMASHSHDMGILATDIAHCTIMFVSLTGGHDGVKEGKRGGGLGPPRRGSGGYQEGCMSPDVAEFYRLHAVCLDLDMVVNDSVLYKYQHVGEWYIIACPNAAEPFGQQQNVKHKNGQSASGAPGHSSYATEMIGLAFRLLHVAHRHGFDLQTGIHSGSAAGAVLGQLRAFYCIYGDTVNTASRLCKKALPGQVHASKGFVDTLLAERAAVSTRELGQEAGSHGLRERFSSQSRTRMALQTADSFNGGPEILCTSRGKTLLKGFDTSIETYDISAEATFLSNNGGKHGPTKPATAANASSRVDADFDVDGHWQKMESFNVDAFNSSFLKRDSKARRRRSSESLEATLKYLETETDSSNSYNVDAFNVGEGTKAATGAPGGPGGPGLRERLNRSYSQDDDPLVSLLEYQDLSTESRVLLNDERIASSLKMAVSYGFESEVLEDEYRIADDQHLHRRQVGGIIVFLCGLVFQHKFVLYPETPFDLDAIGPELTEAYHQVERLLVAHMTLQVVFCAGLGAVIWQGPLRWAVGAGQALAWIRIIWVGVSLYAASIWPVKQFTICFSMLFVLSQFLIVSISFAHFVVIFLFFNALCAASFWCNRDIITISFAVRFWCTSTAVWMFNVWVEDAKRRTMRLHRVFRTEMRRLQNILNDLLPLGAADSSKTDVRSGDNKHASHWQTFNSLKGINSCHERHAVVLQLDICGFTEFSRKMTALELANALHHIFSAFDTCVQNLNFFKMDTVGDAYIVAAWLSEEEAELSGGGGGGKGKDICKKMLKFAGSMLDTIDAYRAKNGHRMSARIGIGMSKVVVGALGSLQPRLHIRGDGMRQAEILEQSGTPGMVHVSDSFIALSKKGASLQPAHEPNRCRVTGISGIDVSLGGTGRMVYESRRQAQEQLNTILHEWRVVGVKAWDDEARGSDLVRPKTCSCRNSFLLRKEGVGGSVG